MQCVMSWQATHQTYMRVRTLEKVRSRCTGNACSGERERAHPRAEAVAGGRERNARGLLMRATKSGNETRAH